MSDVFISYQQLHSYLRTYVQPLMRAGKQLDFLDILYHVTIGKPKIVQQIGHRVLTDILHIIDFGQ